MSLEKEKVDSLKVQWKKLWREQLNDKVRAEGIAAWDYSDLFVDKGTIIHATRDFKALDFKDILKRHQIVNTDRFIPPDPSVGGWGVFIKKSINTIGNSDGQRHRRAVAYKNNYENSKEKQQPKKGGRGWLHVIC